MTPRFSTLVISGGSLKCTAYIGCIKYLEENDYIRHFTRYIGTSAGAIMSLMLAIGMNSEQILQSTLDFVKLQSEHPPNIDNIINIFYTMGVDDGQVLETYIRGLLTMHLKVQDITFIDFAKRTGKDLVISSCILKKMEEVYFCVNNTPNMSIIQAIRASTAIPLIFTPAVINNTIYVDAGLIANFPSTYITQCHLRDVLGLNTNDQVNITKPDEDFNMLDILGLLVEQSIRRLNRLLPLDSNIHVIPVNTANTGALEFHFDINTFQFTIDRETVEKYMKQGYDIIKAYLETLAQDLETKLTLTTLPTQSSPRQ